MATTVHLPADVLKALDKRARVLGVSRNKLIVNAIKRDLGLAEANGWPPGFFESFGGMDDETKRTFDETMADVAKSRRSKKHPVEFE